MLLSDMHTTLTKTKECTLLQTVWPVHNPDKVESPVSLSHLYMTPSQFHGDYCITICPLHGKFHVLLSDLAAHNLIKWSLLYYLLSDLYTTLIKWGLTCAQP